MAFSSGGFLDDIMDDLLYPQSKIEAIGQGLCLILFYPILVLVALPLSYFISFILGLLSASRMRKCDCCRKDKTHNVRSPLKFYWFCEDCLDRYSNLESEFLNSSSVNLANKVKE